MINLTKIEKDWIKLCKGHYKSKYPFKGEWTETIKTMFIEIYGWNPDEDNNYRNYLDCVFNKLLKIHLKIQNDKSGTNLQLRGIFEAAFYKGICRDQELPIERAIAKLCGLIQSNTVIKDGVNRYKL